MSVQYTLTIAGIRGAELAGIGEDRKLEDRVWTMRETRADSIGVMRSWVDICLQSP